MRSSTARNQGKQNIEDRIAVVRRQRILIGIAAALVVLYLVIAVHYAFHFEPKSFVNGIDVSGMSLKEAKQKLLEVADGYTLTVLGPENQEETIDGGEIGLVIKDASNAKLCLKAQPSLSWLRAMFREKRYRVDLQTGFDESALLSRLDAMPMLQEEDMEAPEDAYLSVSEDGSYVIVPEKTGTMLRTGEARDLIMDAALNARPEVDLTAAQDLPSVYRDDANLITRRDEWNAFMVSAGLTYRVGDTEEVLDGPVIASLLSDDGEHVELSYAKTADLMSEWKDRHDTYSSSFEFQTSYGGTVMIEPYGDYGFELDEEDTCRDVMEKITSHSTGVYDASYFHEAPYNTNHGLGGNYVEVSIDYQHLWVYKDGVCVCDTDVVTGMPKFGSVTYHGCYAIKKKETEVVLGDLDVEGYESPVSYWLPFNSGEGIHDAPWRDYFGGKIWLSNGSHGCVNAPDWCMDDIFNNVEVGEAVVVYGKEYDESVYQAGSKTVNENYYYDVYYGGE